MIFLSSPEINFDIIRAIAIPITRAMSASNIIVFLMLSITDCVSDSLIKPIRVQPVTASFDVTI